MSTQGLGRYYPAGNGTTLPRGGGGAVRPIPATLTIAGILPTPGEVSTAIQNAYGAASATPRPMDIIYMTQFHYLVTGSTNIFGSSITSNDIFRVTFTVGGVGYIAFQLGPNRLI